MDLDFSPVWSGWPQLLQGALVTVEVTSVSLLLGCVLGLLIGMGRLHPERRWVYGFCTAYLAVIRGTPLLVQLFLIFYGLPSVGILLDAFPAALIGFTLNIGAYTSEVIRAAISSVPKGQWEASFSISMNWSQAIRRTAAPRNSPRWSRWKTAYSTPSRTC